MKKAKISQNNARFAGINGFCTEVNSYGNVMFYPENMEPVYRVCLAKEDIIFDGEK